MNRHLRNVLATAVTAGVLLTASGCATPSPTIEPPASSSQTAAPVKTEKVRSSPPGGVQSFTFESPLRNKFIPSPWLDNAGWTQTSVTQMVSLPNHVGYAFQGKSKNSTGFEIYNDEGKVVAQIATAPEIVGNEGVMDHEVMTTWQDGKMYVVYLQTGRGADDEAVNVLTSFDEDANEVSRKVLPAVHTFTIDTGAVVIKDYQGSGDDVVFDPATGEVEVVSDDKGREWVGRVDGVDIYKVGETLESENWKIDHPFFDVTGKYFSVLTEREANKCEIFDPHTGKAIAGNDGGCATPVGSSDPEENFPSTATEALVLQGADNNTVIFLPEENKSVTISEPWFEALSVDSNGVFYGVTGTDPKLGPPVKTPVYVDVKNGGELTPMKDGKLAPVLISGNGIAAFSEMHGFYDTIQFALPKA